MGIPIDPAVAMVEKCLLHQKAMNDVIDRGDSPVQQFYSGAKIFITGGSGFLGKQLIEKLFRACDISKVYVLLRPKKGKSVEDRLHEIMEDPVFELVRKKKPDFENKIVAVAGDVADNKLGLSDNDWNTLTQEVDIIFHVAATTRFDESLNVATLINVRGTREALILGHACKNLRSFVHVSTAFSNATEKTLKEEVLEKFYPAPIDPETLIGLVESFDEQKLKELEAVFIRGYPNTYTFAKAVGEAEVRKWSGKFPLCIVRPAVVISAYIEPAPGWTDMSCVYGASGLVTAPALGLMHVGLGNEDMKLSMVPVDYVNNAIIAAGYETGKTGRNDEPKIYTVSNANNAITWRVLAAKLNRIRTEFPSPLAIWYIFCIITSNVPLFIFLSSICHFIPALIIDTICFIMGKTPRFVKLAQKMYNTSRALSYFTTRGWSFSETNTDKLYQGLSGTDKSIFKFDTSDIDHDEHAAIWVIGLRKYIFKDGLVNTVYAQKKQFWLKILHVIVCVIYFYTLWKLFSLVCCGLQVFAWY